MPRSLSKMNKLLTSYYQLLSIVNRRRQDVPSGQNCSGQYLTNLLLVIGFKKLLCYCRRLEECNRQRIPS
jgi:hypothetical protein